MRIVVVTPYDSSNFGAYLQAFCLKLQLEKMGHEVVHIPTRDKEYVRNLYYKDKPISKKDKLMPWKFHKKMEFGKRKLKLFESEQKLFCVVEPENANADICILGSDEIWNINQPAFRNLIFWGKGFTPVISYATSIGKAEKDLFRKYPELVNALRKLNKIAVRDERTKEFVAQYTGKEPEVVCDPTMLIPISEYGKEYEDEYIVENKCLLIYAYSLKKSMQKSIQAYAKKHGLKTVACCFQHDWCDYQCECTPLQFSSLIKQCDAVITTTFHGSIFSILNHANFVSIPTSPKTSQLLAQFGLEKRCLSENDFSLNSLENIMDRDIIDYIEVETKLEQLRTNSIEYLKNAIEAACKEAPTFDYQICSSNDCTGCFACKNKCPKQAIHCVVDAMGRTVPQIDPEKCVKCGLCKQVCPQLNTVDMCEPSICYAAQRKDEGERMQSASGGVAAALTDNFIVSGGVVYGAAVQDGKAVHTRADKKEQGDKFKGSKYVQSDIGDCYKDVLEQLNIGKKVLFTGTPCQIAGLKKYLGKVYDNLYCVDIICHGVPPMQYLKEHIKSVTGGKNVDDFSFRGGENDFYLNLRYNGKLLYHKKKSDDTYYYSFYKGLISRENCYRCVYAKSERCSDMTIGDFWGLGRKTLSTQQQGKISVILLNTDKGNELFSSIKGEFVYEERLVEEAVQGNAQLRRPSLIHPKRKKFISLYAKNSDFESAVLQCGIKKEMWILNIKRMKLWRGLRRIKQIMKH